MSRYSIYHVPLEHLRTLWHELLEVPFPPGLAGAHIDGIDVSRLDTESCALIERFLKSNGNLSERDASSLAYARQQVERLLPQLEEKARQYFELLYSLTQHVLDEIAEHMLHSRYGRPRVELT
jgi:hypothetical protein